MFVLIFFCILYFNKSIRNQVFSNQPLTILCFFVWILCIFTFGFIIYDIQKILEIQIDNHELNKEAYLDNLTGIPNRTNLDKVFINLKDEAVFKKMGCGIIQLINLNDVNDKFGHTSGDNLIQDFSNIFEAVGDKYGFVERNGGNEYLALFEECDHLKMKSFFTDLNTSISLYNQNSKHLPIEIIYAYVLNTEINTLVMSDLIGQAYKELTKAHRTNQNRI
jgi:diguanylate cyclase (GGDEF)-like protein